MIRTSSTSAGSAPVHRGGFTLIELLAVLAVLVVLIMIGVPSFGELTASQRIQTAAADLFTSLLLARSEAIKQNADVTLSPSGNWPAGWVVASASGNLEVHGAVPNIAITGPASATYRNNGRVAETTMPKFSFSSARTSTKRCVQVGLGGQPVVTQAACL